MEIALRTKTMLVMKENGEEFIVGSPEAAAVLSLIDNPGNFFASPEAYTVNTGRAITDDGKELIFIDYEMMDDEEIIEEVTFLRSQPPFYKNGEMYIEVTEDIVQQYNTDLAIIEGRYATTN